MNVLELNSVAKKAVLCALCSVLRALCSVLLLVHIQVTRLQTTVHPNARALENLTEHTIAHTCTLEHNDATMLHWYNFILLHYSIALLINIELILFLLLIDVAL